ncbi:MAG: cytochrome c3 family protein [Gemmatimonadales bacterium]|nr:cytochrome c3 family protein [Gemmatimonadales bacterium]
MKISSRVAAGVLVAALGATALALYRPSTGELEIAAASLDPSSFLHVQESADPQAAGEGETAAAAAQFAEEQDLATMPAQWRAIYDHEHASRGPEQPIPFNHRFHVTDLQIDCMYCHVGTERSVSGGVPTL